MDFTKIVSKAVKCIKENDLSKEYKKKLLFEIKEIQKQGLEDYWIETIESGKTFEDNKNGLIMPFLLGITNIDPIKDSIEHNIYYDTEFPDIDIDFLPTARDPVKEYAAEKYGVENVCSVGTWNTYKNKSAMQDAARALDLPFRPVLELTVNLPAEFDDMSKEQALDEYSEFREWYTLNEENKQIADLGFTMVNRIRSQGKHAGGLIISSVPVVDHIPLTISNDQWTSSWTEGRSLQLSKFGFIKFDFLGLKTLQYLYNAEQLIKKNRGVTIDWSIIDPEEDIAGHEIDAEGNKKVIRLNDEPALALADKLLTEAVFQFDTDVAKGILSEGGVKSFNDLVMYTSLGRPGPMPMVKVFVSRRDGEDWESDEHPKIADLLRDTHGIIVFQEQLAAMWQMFGGFSAVEAGKARKAVAKKWVDKLAYIEEKWMKGAGKTLGEDKAADLWDSMVTFGRYAFNKSHATAYCLLSQRQLYLKSRYPAEFWAGVLSDCHIKKRIKYINTSKSEGVKFNDIDVNHLSNNFNVVGDSILPGTSMIKNMPSALCTEAEIYIKGGGKFKSLNHFCEVVGKSKTLCERLIKLGGFDEFTDNRKALWHQYIWNHKPSGSEMTKIRHKMKWSYAWTKEQIDKERKRQLQEFKDMYPNRKVIPQKIFNWVPKRPHPDNEVSGFGLRQGDLPDKEEKKLFAKIELTDEMIADLFKYDRYTPKELLGFEMEYMGFHWHNPLQVFETEGYDIEFAKENGVLECLIQEIEKATTSNESEYYRIQVTDGLNSARMMVWMSEAENQNPDVFKVGAGLLCHVSWHDKFRSFNLERGTSIIPLDYRTDDFKIE